MESTERPRTAMASLASSAEAAGSGALQFITCKLGDQEYGLNIMAVREIRGWSDTTVIPRAPEHIRGVINLRGLIVPILDLRARFGLGLTTPSPTHAVIIVTPSTGTFGLMVDAVSDIVAVEPAAISPVPDVGQSTEDRFLSGMVVTGGRMVTLVSLDGLFSKAASQSLAALAGGVPPAEVQPAA